jgi:hypothetical protein
MISAMPHPVDRAPYIAPLAPETEEMLIASSMLWDVRFINGTYYRRHKTTRELQVFTKIFTKQDCPLAWDRVWGQAYGIDELFNRPLRKD